jgi:hypothetical protein
MHISCCVKMIFMHNTVIKPEYNLYDLCLFDKLYYFDILVSIYQPLFADILLQ